MNNLQAEPQYGGSTRNLPVKPPVKVKLLNTKQVARMLKVSTSTVINYHGLGKIKHATTKPGRGGLHYYFTKESIEQFAANNTIRHIKRRKKPVELNGATPKGFNAPTELGRIQRLVFLLNKSNSPLEATVESVKRAAIRIGLDQLEKDAKK